MSGVKIACLGGGSLYFPRLLGDLALNEDLAGSEVVLYDLDVRKCEAMVALGERFAEEAGTHLHFRAATELADALDGAGFAVASIGGSGAEVTSNVYSSHHHAADMSIPAKYGVHQVVGDTAGPAGMMMGLRAIPAYLAICEEMERRCPAAPLISHSNPMAVLCRAMTKYSDVNVIGICHGVQATVQQAADMLSVPSEELECIWIGTNHYYWVLKATRRGEDLTDALLAKSRELGGLGAEELVHRLSAIYGCKFGYPGAGHIVEFHSWGTRGETQASLPYGLVEEAKRHGFDVSTAAVPMREEPTDELQREFYAKYQAILDECRLPKADEIDYINQEGVARMISAIHGGRREVFIVNIPNGGMIPNLPPEALVEVEAVSDSRGVRGISIGECPTVLKGILEKRFAWQELVVDAAVTGDRNLALQAMLLDEMAVAPDAAETMLEELLEGSRDMLPSFFR